MFQPQQPSWTILGLENSPSPHTRNPGMSQDPDTQISAFLPQSCESPQEDIFPCFPSIDEQAHAPRKSTNRIMLQLVFMTMTTTGSGFLHQHPILLFLTLLLLLSQVSLSIP